MNGSLLGGLHFHRLIHRIVLAARIRGRRAMGEDAEPAAGKIDVVHIAIATGRGEGQGAARS